MWQTLFGMQEDRSRKGKLTNRQEITINESVYSDMTKADLSEAIQRELQLVQQDIKMERTKDKKNSLESYVYEMRDKVHLYIIAI